MRAFNKANDRERRDGEDAASLFLNSIEGVEILKAEYRIEGRKSRVDFLCRYKHDCPFLVEAKYDLQDRRVGDLLKEAWLIKRSHYAMPLVVIGRNVNLGPAGIRDLEDMITDRYILGYFDASKKGETDRCLNALMELRPPGMIGRLDLY